VCAYTKTLNTRVCLRSYATEISVESLSAQDCAIWEAARATSAAATFFDPIRIGRQEFVDGATGANNPVELVFDEAMAIWPNATSRIQCLVSIGTGVPELRDFGDNLKEIAQTLKIIATETEETEARFSRSLRFRELEGRYFRFNVLKGLRIVGLDKFGSLDTVEAATEQYLQDHIVRDQLDKFAAVQPPRLARRKYP